MISKKLIKELQWLASHKDNEFVLSAKDARALLTTLGYDWCPQLNKGTTKREAFLTFKRGLQEKFGRKNVRIEWEEDEYEGRLFDRVELAVPDVTDQADAHFDSRIPSMGSVQKLINASGFGRYFQPQVRAHFRRSGWKDLSFVSKRGRKKS